MAGKIVIMGSCLTALSMQGSRFPVIGETVVADGSATPEAVAAMIKAAAGRIKVKPSGGIRNYATAVFVASW